VSVSVVECVSEPLLPVIVIVKRDLFGTLRELTVSVDVDDVEVGENDSVRADDVSVADSATVPAKLPCGAIVTMNEADEFRLIVPEDGLTEIVKSPVCVTACTTSVAETEWLVPLLVPTIVNGYVPPASEPFVATVSVESPDFVIELGLKVGVAPAGSPVAVRLTVPEKPFCAPTDTEYWALPPAVTVCDDEDVSPTVKSGWATVLPPNATSPFGVPSPVGPS
jgi:hypothetical protein